MSKQEKNYTPLHIANYFIWLAEHEKVKNLTPMKLIKLVYIGYAWYFYTTEELLFDEKVEAWVYGPVIPSVYEKFKKFGNKPIDRYASDMRLNEEGELQPFYPMIRKDDKQVINLMASIFYLYRDDSARQLSEKTHRDGGVWEYVRQESPSQAHKPKIDMDNEEVQRRIIEGAKLGIEKLQSRNAQKV